jgi:conjugative transfer region protein TrbK
MDGKMLARLGAVVFVAVAVTATAIEMTRKEDEPAGPAAGRDRPSAGRSAARRADPLPGLGEAGPRDPACLRAWAENRDRFLAPGARPTERLPDIPPAPRDTSYPNRTAPISRPSSPPHRSQPPQLDEAR